MIGHVKEGKGHATARAALPARLDIPVCHVRRMLRSGQPLRADQLRWAYLPSFL